VGAFPGNIEDWWIKDFWYIYCNMITGHLCGAGWWVPLPVVAQRTTTWWVKKC
jgi:hypothetical protein